MQTETESTQTSPKSPPSTNVLLFSLPRALAALVMGRLAVDMALRSPVPFLGDIATALGQRQSDTGWLATAMTLALLLAPFTGVLSARFGQRALIFVPLGIFVVVCAVMPLAPNFTVVLLLFVLLGLAKALFDPQVQAFLGEHVPYHRRGTAIGIVELSWAVAWAIGVPMFGLLLSRVAWWAPFWVIGLLALFAIFLQHKFVPMTPTPSRDSRNNTNGFSLASWRVVFGTPGARYVVLFGVSLFVAAQLPYMVYPIWFKQHFNLSIEQLGFASTVLSAADLLAELLTIVLVDRIGKRRSVLIAAAGCALAFIAFWALSDSLVGMLVAMFLIYFCFEFALVASLPVASEMVPAARSTMMGFATAAAGLGRITGALIALPLFGINFDRLWLVASVGFIAAALAFAFGWRMTHQK